jgi:hypothetical protein
MPKKLCAWRLSETVIDRLTKLEQTLKHKSIDNTLLFLLDRLQYLEDVAQQEPKAVDAPECRRRINHLGKWYCIETSDKGFKKMRELVNLEICKICRLEKYRIPEKARSNIKLTPLEEAAQMRNPNKAVFKDAGLTYCMKDTIWVFPAKCERCTTKCEAYLQSHRGEGHALI